MKPRLLIVDDDAAIRAALAERFAARAYAVRAASSGEEALEEARRGTELVLLDLMLPRGGPGCASCARRSSPPPWSITAHGSVAKAVEAMREGPATPQAVRARGGEETLRRALERTARGENRSCARSGRARADRRGSGHERVLALARKAARSDATGSARRERHARRCGAGGSPPRERARGRAVRGRELRGAERARSSPSLAREGRLHGRRGARRAPRRPTAARSSWTRSATRAPPSRRSCCASSRRGASSAWAGIARWRSTCA
jgi:CheY-like chemotaxis protein